MLVKEYCGLYTRTYPLRVELGHYGKNKTNPVITFRDHYRPDRAGLGISWPLRSWVRRTHSPQSGSVNSVPLIHMTTEHSVRKASPVYPSHAMDCCGVEESGHAGTSCHLLLLLLHGIPNRELLPLYIPLALFLAHCSYSGGKKYRQRCRLIKRGSFTYTNLELTLSLCAIQ